jgi:hypothetical protein
LSKLADKIKAATRISAGGIGFGTTREAVEPTIVLVGIARDARDAADLQKRGAVAVVLTGARPENGGDVQDAIAGAAIAGKADDEAKAYREGGFDFVVFDPNQASATALLDEKTGYIMSIPKDFDEHDLRALEAFQLDAIDVGVIDGTLTVRRQIELRRVFGMTRKPLMARLKGDISSAELQALRDTGVVVVASDRADDVERLRKTIDGLPPRARRRDDDRPAPFVPQAASGGDDDDDHDHDD